MTVTQFLFLHSFAVRTFCVSLPPILLSTVKRKLSVLRGWFNKKSKLTL